MSIHDENKAWFDGFIGSPKRILRSFGEDLAYKQGKDMREGNICRAPRVDIQPVPLWKISLIILVMALIGIVLFLSLSRRGLGTMASLSISIPVAFIAAGAAKLILDYIWVILLVVCGVAVYNFLGPFLHG